MSLSGGAIAGIVIVCVLALVILIFCIYFIIKKKRQDAEYTDRCGRLLKKYGGTKQPKVMAKFPYAEPTYVRAPLPGQEFTPKELHKDTEFVVPLKYSGDEDGSLPSMQTPIDPASINPSLYTKDEISVEEAAQTSTHLGGSSKHFPQVFFSVEYDETYHILQVHVHQARFLETRDSSGVCDPYCKVVLLPEAIEKQSRIHKRTTEPLFQENFSFEVDPDALPDKKIQIKFYENDRYSRDEFTGIVEQNLDEIDLRNKVHLWKKISPPELDSRAEGKERAGDILLRLGYLPSAEKLTVVLLKVRSLKEVGKEGRGIPPDPYVRVALFHDGNLLKKKKTSTKKKTSNPTFNQAINFAIPLDVLPQVEMQFHVVHEAGLKLTRAERKEVIGVLEIGPHSTGDELEHWRDLMGNKPQARWHRLTVPHSTDPPSGSEQSGLSANLAASDLPSTSRS